MVKVTDQIMQKELRRRSREEKREEKRNTIELARLREREDGSNCSFTAAFVFVFLGIWRTERECQQG